MTDGGRRQTRWSTEVSYTHESCVSRRYSSLPEYRSAAMAHTDESTDPATKSIPDETIMSPKPVSGETSPPAANPKAPSKAEAAPACSLPASMARVLDDVKVSPSIVRRQSSSISYSQKLHPRHIAAHNSTETAAIPMLPVRNACSIVRNFRERAAAAPIASALAPKHVLNIIGENP